MSDAALRPIPPGYLLTLSLALVSLPCLGIGLGGLLIQRRGGHPLDAMNGVGLVCFVAAYAVVFSMRLIFWPKAPPGLRAAVRVAITLVLCVLLVASAYAVFVAATTSNADGTSFYFVVLAAFSQVATVIWLLRYRKVQ